MGAHLVCGAFSRGWFLKLNCFFIVWMKWFVDFWISVVRRLGVLGQS